MIPSFIKEFKRPGRLFPRLPAGSDGISGTVSGRAGRRFWHRSASLLFACLFLISAESVLFAFGKNKVNRETFHWHLLKTIHYDIYYPYGMEDLAKNTARIAEEAYVHIANYLNHEMTQVVPIIVYPSHIDFQENNVISMIIGEGVGGFTESLKNRVVVPFTGSYREFRHVLTHELVHSFQYNIMFDDISGTAMSRFVYRGIPLWLMEGMAEYLSIGFDETADMVMRDILYNDQYATLMDLTRLQVRSGYLIYKEGQAFYYFLEKVYGRDKIGEIFRDARDNNILKAIKINTGKTLEELNLEFIRFFKKRYYPVVKGKRFDEEEGSQITKHLKTFSSFNVSPAVSPDGRKIAYLTNRDIYSSINIITLDKKKKKKKEIRTVLWGDTSSKFEGMHLLSNYLTWSRDGKHIVFVAQSHGRDVIFLIDAEKGRVKREVRLPFRALMDPSLSPDCDSLVFVGQDNSSADIYLYDLKKNTLRRITSDLFMDRYPKLSSDNSFLIYSSNWNAEGNYEREGFRIFRIDLKTGRRTLVVGREGNNLQADISADDRRLLYISNRTGIYNAYRYDLEKRTDERITNVLCGIFYPRWFPDGKQMAFVAYQNLGYDVFVKDISKVKGDAGDVRDTEYLPVQYPRSYFDLSRSEFDEYQTRVRPDYLVLGLAGTVGYGFAGFARLEMSDHLGDHRIVLMTDYLNYSGGQSDFNYDVAYYYLKYRWDYGIGFFRYKNPFGIITLNTINDLIQNVYWDTLYTDHYGGYLVASYPFSKFFRFGIRGTSSRYERDYRRSSGRTDVFANLNQVALTLNYDNVLWGYMVPVDGTRGEIQVEQSFDLSGQDFVYSSMDIDLRHYFLIKKRYVIAVRGSGGKILGPDSDYFKYYIGGFSTLRGHPFFEYSGTNMFMGNAEFRFDFIEGIKFGWPLFFRVGSIGGALFTDVGSAWDKNFRFRDKTTGRFDTFKADMGFGFRFAIYPIVVLKLDWAWPYYYNDFGKKDIIFSLGFEY